MGPVGCLQEEVLDTVSDLRLQPPVDDQATCSHSHAPLLTAPRAVEAHRGSNRNNIHIKQTSRMLPGKKSHSVLKVIRLFAFTTQLNCILLSWNCKKTMSSSL